MGEIFTADLAELHDLAIRLNAHADVIGQIKIDAKVTMPDSPLGALVDKATTTIGEAYGLLGTNIRTMATTVHDAKTTYEDLEHALAAQFQSYVTGADAKLAPGK